MRFLHIADLHIGKTVNEFSMLEDQKYILNQIVELAETEGADAVVIAGDLYDRSVPPAQAVTVLDAFFRALSERGIPVLAVAGNHDSPERLNFASSILEKQGLYLAGIYDGEILHTVLRDEWGPVHFYLLPFVKPAAVNDCLGTDCRDFQEALQAVLSRIPETKERSVMVTHQFVTWAGRMPEQSDSEQALSVGGAETVDVSLFDRFDYTALGHLHRCQKIGNREVWYAGSPLKYSKSETAGKKYALLAEMDAEGKVCTRKLELKPLREMRCIRGPLNELVRPEIAAAQDREDYLFVTLTDEGALIDPMRILRDVYPNTMQIERERLAQTEEEEQQALKELKKLEPMELFERFFTYATRGSALNEEDLAALKEIMEEAKGAGE